MSFKKKLKENFFEVDEWGRSVFRALLFSVGLILIGFLLGLNSPLQAHFISKTLLKIGSLFTFFTLLKPLFFLVGYLLKKS